MGTFEKCVTAAIIVIGLGFFCLIGFAVDKAFQEQRACVTANMQYVSGNCIR